jgi:hypothetical protein
MGMPGQFKVLLVQAAEILPIVKKLLCDPSQGWEKPERFSEILSLQGEARSQLKRFLRTNVVARRAASEQ